MSHTILRETIEWGTYGKNGDESLKKIKVKDISDDHLKNIIYFIENNYGHYSENILNVMIDEVAYRKVNQIFVPDYIVKNFKFGNNKKQQI